MESSLHMCLHDSCVADAACFQGVQEVFVLCTNVEMCRYRVNGLLDGYRARVVVTHHYPVHEGIAPDIVSCLALLDELRECLEDGKRMVIHCFEGLGRSCLNTLTADQAITTLCSARGSQAIQTIKQYKFVQEFRTLSEAHREARFLTATARSVSR
uniref:cyclin-dependent kinase inhibitor 3 n=1 Tax=Myxine glutinosa TaxID=7769 RepID=UPI00358EB542